MIEAKFWKREGDKVRCLLCPHFCLIDLGHTGRCGVRRNIDGRLFTLSYGRVVASNLDPIEKKPIYHFLPGSLSFSIATPGCNFQCQFCQNWQISQMRSNIEKIPFLEPDYVVDLALKYGAKSISYTYTEPTIFYEYAYDVSQLAHKNHLANIFVSNGFINPEPVKELKGLLDAVNIDLKSFRDETYRKICGGRLDPVLDTIRLMYELGIWVEITTLIIPGLNDSDEELEDIAEFIASLSLDIPWHISAFHPDYKMLDRTSTSLQTLLRAETIGRKVGLRYIYLGNVAREGNTYCPNCGMLLVRRIGFNVLENYLSINGGCCPECGFKVEGVWTDWVDNHFTGNRG